jgi:hypothetical protein
MKSVILLTSGYLFTTVLAIPTAPSLNHGKTDDKFFITGEKSNNLIVVRGANFETARCGVSGWESPALDIHIQQAILSRSLWEFSREPERGEGMFCKRYEHIERKTLSHPECIRGILSRVRNVRRWPTREIRQAPIWETSSRLSLEVCCCCNRRMDTVD